MSRTTLLKLNAYAKGLLLAVKPHYFLGFLRRPLLMGSNVLALSNWISVQDKEDVMNDFYTAKRDYPKRFQLHQYVVEKFNLQDESIDYLEFGVCEGTSFTWWASHNHHAESKFYGFDTFEGLPEDWGGYDKGEMAAKMPVLQDARTLFIKGLFQDTLPGFLASQNLRKGVRKLVHLDADLFSSTLFALTSLAPYLKKGDILLFDEFNVPNHEFFAFKIFCESYYVKTRLIGAVNNYYQVALIIE